MGGTGNCEVDSPSFFTPERCLVLGTAGRYFSGGLKGSREAEGFRFDQAVIVYTQITRSARPVRLNIRRGRPRKRRTAIESNIRRSSSAVIQVRRPLSGEQFKMMKMGWPALRRPEERRERIHISEAPSQVRTGAGSGKGLLGGRRSGRPRVPCCP